MDAIRAGLSSRHAGTRRPDMRRLAPYGSATDRLRALQVEADAVKIEPFALSDTVHLRVPVPPPGPAHRLHLWMVDEDNRVVARTYIDAAPVEGSNGS